MAKPGAVEPVATSAHAKSHTGNHTKSHTRSHAKNKRKAQAKARRKRRTKVAADGQPRALPLKRPKALVPVRTASIPTKPQAGTPRSVRKRVVYRSQREICDTVAKAAQTNKLPMPFFIRLLFQESRFDAAAVSHAGAEGIAQFMPDTAHGVGLANPFDPLQAIPAAAQLLRDLIDRFGNLGLAAAAYNAGPAKVDHWLKRNTELPAETRGYVKTITGKPAKVWKARKVVHSDTDLPDKAPCRPVVAPHAVVATVSVPLPPPRAHAAPRRTAHAAGKRRSRRHIVSAGKHVGHHGKARLELAARRHRTQDARD